MVYGLVIFLIFALITAANILAVRQNERLNQLFFLTLFVANIPILLAGIMLAIIPESDLQTLQAEAGLTLKNPFYAGVVLQLTAVWGILVTLRRTRHGLAQTLNIDPDSPVHVLALLFCGYIVGNVGMILAQGGLEQIAETATAVSITEVLLQPLLFAMAALVGVGLPVRRSLTAVADRLGLTRLNSADLLIGLRWIMVLVALQWVVGAGWALLDPTAAEALGGVNDLLLANVDTVWEWLLLALAAGIGEELLFRGALQPVLGLPLTAVVFAIGHVQYGLTPITLLVFVLGIILGRIRQRHSTSLAIFVHAGYNFTLGLIALLVPYLESIANNAS